MKRFARDTVFHWGLRKKLAEYGASVECPNFNFEDSPEGEFVETIVAAQGQLERQQNRRQTLQKMKARLEKGYAVFQVPVGYRYERSKSGGKVLVFDEPTASILREAMEGFASGRFQTKAEVAHFLNEYPEFPRGASGTFGRSRIDEIFTRVAYAGYIEHEPWDVSLREGQHEGIITYETFLKIQERMRGRAHAPARKNINEDFPLRGFVDCECGKPLTAGWTKGRSAHYPYYYCQAKSCDHYGKSIKRDLVDGDFEKILHKLTPSQELFAAASMMLEKLWQYRADYRQARIRNLEDELTKAERQIDKLLERIVDADSSVVMKAFEKKIKTLEEWKLVLNEKIRNSEVPTRGRSETYRTVMDFIAKPYKLWASTQLECKRAVLKLAFDERLTYVRNEGYRTAKTTLPFKHLGGFCDQKVEMVEVSGDTSNRIFEILDKWELQFKLLTL